MSKGIHFDLMEARHLCSDAIDWLEANPEQHTTGDFIRYRATGDAVYHVPEPGREQDYCYCFLGRVAQEARNRHPEQCEGIMAGSLACAVIAPLSLPFSDAFKANDRLLRLERAPSTWKRLMIALDLRTPHENTQTIATLRQTLAENYAAQATKELLS